MSLLRFVEEVRSDRPVETLWRLLSDTDRLNKTIGLPSISFSNQANLEQGHFKASTRFFGVDVSYEEFPFEWVENRFHFVRRDFDGGAFKRVRGGIELMPESAGTRVSIIAEIEPRGITGRLFAKLFAKNMAGRVRKLIETQSATRTTKINRPPTPVELNRAQFSERMKMLRSAGAPARLSDALAHDIETLSDLDVTRLRPFEWADRWAADRFETLKFFFDATQAGVTELNWSVLCPHCPGSSSSKDLSQLRSTSDCDTCRINFKTDLQNSVEVTFSVHPAVRRARERTFCIGGPANTPRLIAQLRLEPGETRSVDLTLRDCPLKTHCYQTGDPTVSGVSPESKTDAVGVTMSPQGLSVSPETVKPGLVHVQLKNTLATEALVTFEQESWREKAATAAQVLVLQEFRDHFPNTTVASGEEIAVGRLAFMFTDLKGSTQLYQAAGDTKAFDFVQTHFRYLLRCVADHHGGVVKTMGDAIMATFLTPRQAMDAALAMQKDWANVLKEHPEAAQVLLKIGVHQGAAIAINNNGRLDYFGGTINLSARTQNESKGADIVFTTAIHDDPDVKSLLATRTPPQPFQAELKGIAGPQTLFCLKP